MVTRWRADRAAIEGACAEIGLRYGVHIMPGRMKNCRGRYTGLDNDGWHNIVVHEHLRSDAASRTIWHEIAHAKQREGHRDPGAFNAWYVAQLRRLGLPTDWYGDPHAMAPPRYRLIPAEVEAHEFEKMHTALPLARAGQPREVWALNARGLICQIERHR